MSATLLTGLMHDDEQTKQITMSDDGSVNSKEVEEEVTDLSNR
jgi:hypothetical protein